MEPVRETVTPKQLLVKFFKPRPELKRYTYITWVDEKGEELIFIRNTNKGKHWLYRGAGAARRALIECICDLGFDNPLHVQEDPYSWINHRATSENVGWYVDELEKRGIIQYKTIESLK